MWGERGDNETDRLTGTNTTGATESRQKKEQPLPQIILSYVTSSVWVILAVICLYYTNFFYQLFHNPKIYEPFFTVSMTCYTVIVLLTLYISFLLPHVFKVQNVQEYNPKLIKVGAVFGVMAVICLLIAIWPVWGFTSLIIFFLLWKGFFEISTFLPGGDFGGILFIIINVLAVFSYKIIEHEGYLH